MPDTIGYDEVVDMLRGAAAQIVANHEMLSKLDSYGGDGDHGTTIKRAMGLVEKAVDGASGTDLKGLLTDVGWGVMGVDGGATGPLLGMFFMGMSEAVEGKDALDAAATAAMIASGAAMLRKQTKAQPGDKTLVDALVPAIEALETAAEGGADVAAALAQAADAAAQGAQATADMQARFGRAKNIGEASKGHPDPGATSMSLIFKGFAEAVGSAQ